MKARFRTGSRAIQDNNALSDYDYIIVDEGIIFPFSIQYNATGKVIQEYHIPYVKLYDFISENLMKVDKALAREGGMIDKAIPYNSGNSDLLKEMKLFAQHQRLDAKPMMDLDVYDLSYRIIICEENLKNATDDTAPLIAAELYIKRMTFLSLMAGGARAGSKHIARAVNKMPIAEDLTRAYLNSVSQHDYRDFLQKRIKTPLDGQKNWSTALFDTVSENGIIMVFINRQGYNLFLKKGMMNDLLRKLCSYEVYYFTASSDNALENGLYIVINSSEPKGKGAYNLLLKFFKTNSEVFIKERIQFAFPIRTAFSTGYTFGGKKCYLSLIPYFKAINDMAKRLNKKDTYNYAINCINTSSAFIPNSKKNLQLYVKSLALYTVDPTALYSSVQLNIMAETLMKQSPGKMGEVRFDSRKEIVSLYEKAFFALNNNELCLPEISYYGSSKEFLSINILDHVMNCVLLDSAEKYALVSLFMSKQ